MDIKDDLLSGPATAGYVPTLATSPFVYSRRLPPFTLHAVREMLLDPRVQFGLYLLKGPILANFRCKVYCDNEDARQFIIDEINSFWQQPVFQALKVLEWGYACLEPVYKLRGGLVHLDTVQELHPIDCRPLTQDGVLVGATVRGVRRKGKVAIGGPRCLWFVHGSEHHPWYGRSRLWGAFAPFMELASEGGYKDIRRLFYHKYAYDGGTLYHPPGSSKVNTDSGSVASQTSNKQLARQLIDQKRTGGTLTLPNEVLANTTGMRSWEYVPPSVNQPPTSVLEYGDRLRSEILEGIGVPPEIAENQGGGGIQVGDNGRSVAQDAYYAILQQIANSILHTFLKQSVDATLEFNFGKLEYNVVPFSLVAEPVQPQQSSLPEEPPPGSEDEGYQLGVNYSKRDRSGKLHGAKGGKNAGQFVGKGDMGTDDDSAKQRWNIILRFNKKAKQWEHSSGKKLPKHVQDRLREKHFPPGATRAYASSNPNAEFHGVWYDNKDRSHQVYNPKFKAKQDEAKQSRAGGINRNYDKIKTAVLKGLNNKIPKISDAYGVFLIGLELGLRAGGSDQKKTKAEHKSYGASDLQASHVKVGSRNNVYLRFTPGKKGGQEISVPVNDRRLAAYLLEKKKKAPHGKAKLFSVSMTTVAKLVKDVAGSSVKFKDLRTAVANRIATEHIESATAPKNEAGYKKALKELGSKVALQLGHSPAEAIKSYVDPSLYHHWKVSAGV